MWATITKPFAWLMVQLYKLTGNYGWAVILFALAVNLILLPFMAKSKKSTMKTTRLQPRMQELQKRYGQDPNNQQKYQQEMQKLYKEEGINPMSGCIWSLIPFPILIALYSVIRQPLARMMFVSDDVITAITNFVTEAGWYTASTGTASAYGEIQIVKIMHEHWSDVIASLQSSGLDISKLIDIDFSFIGLNLGDQPKWNFFMNTDWSDVSVWLPALGLFLIPFVSAFLSWASMKISMAMNPTGGVEKTQQSMNSMNLIMPLMSVYICFVMPAAMGIYWIANSVFGMIRDYVLTVIYKKQLDKEDAERIAARSEREKQIEEQHAETERKRAEGRTEVNTNTSKKKLQASEKQKSDERKAALDREERAARRERLGVTEAEKPASQVGNRRYARGRAYVADRFTNPEAAAEATVLAAAESEGAASIDDAVDEEVVSAVSTAVETAVETETPAESAEE